MKVKKKRSRLFLRVRGGLINYIIFPLKKVNQRRRAASNAYCGSAVTLV